MSTPMSRFITVALSIAIAPALLLGYGRYTESADIIHVAEQALFVAALPASIALLVAAGTLLTARAEWTETSVHTLGRISSSYGVWWVMSVVLFVGMLLLPFESDRHSSSDGWMKLLSGWIFILRGETFVWLAFPLTLLTWIFIALRKPTAATASSILALVIALPFLASPKLTYGWGDNVRSLAQQPEWGYYALLGAIVAALICSIRIKHLPPREDLQPANQQGAEERNFRMWE